MPSVNPGPAQTNNPNAVATLTPVNTQANSTPQESNQLRLLASFRAANLATTGDVLVIPVINASAWTAATVVVANGLVSGVSGTVAAASVGIFTGAGSTGTTVRTAGVLTGQTSTTVTTVAAAASAAVYSTAQNLYLNVGTALANATVDIFVYGYDLS
jgi:hypothetical protein